MHVFLNHESFNSLLEKESITETGYTLKFMLLIPSSLEFQGFSGCSEDQHFPASLAASHGHMTEF